MIGTRSKSRIEQENIRIVIEPDQRFPTPTKKTSDENVSGQDYLVAVNLTVQEWMELHERDEESAILKILNLILRSAGIEKDLTKDDYFQEPASILSDIHDELEANQIPVVHDFPLCEKTRKHKIYRKTFGEFWSRWMNDSYGQETTLSHVVPWIVTLSASPFRQLRISASLAALGMISGGCKACVQLTKELDKVSKLKKSQVSSEIGSNKATAEKIVNSLFDAVFVLRFRDVEGSLRRDSVVHLGNWACLYKEIFLDNSYLRYVGWALSDRSPEVRLAALESFEELLHLPKTNLSALAQFCDRFVGRVVEMARADLDASVRKEAAKLVGLLLSHSMIETDELAFVDEIVRSGAQLTAPMAKLLLLRLGNPSLQGIIEYVESLSVEYGPIIKALFPLMSFQIEEVVETRNFPLILAVAEKLGTVKLDSLERLLDEETPEICDLLVHLDESHRDIVTPFLMKMFPIVPEKVVPCFEHFKVDLVELRNELFEQKILHLIAQILKIAPPDRSTREIREIIEPVFAACGPEFESALLIGYYQVLWSIKDNQLEESFVSWLLAVCKNAPKDLQIKTFPIYADLLIVARQEPALDTIWSIVEPCLLVPFAKLLYHRIIRSGHEHFFQLYSDDKADLFMSVWDSIKGHLEPSEACLMIARSLVDFDSLNSLVKSFLSYLKAAITTHPIPIVEFHQILIEREKFELASLFTSILPPNISSLIELVKGNPMAKSYLKLLEKQANKGKPKTTRRTTSRSTSLNQSITNSDLVNENEDIGNSSPLRDQSIANKNNEDIDNSSDYIQTSPLKTINKRMITL